MDETAIYIDDFQRTIGDTVGSKHVLLKRTCFASIRITVDLVVQARRDKVISLVIFMGIDNGVERKYEL